MEQYEPYLIAAGLGLSLSLVLLFLKRLAWRRLQKWAGEGAMLWPIRPPLNALLILIALACAIQVLPDPLRTHTGLTLTIKTLFILCLLWLVNRSVTVGVEVWRPAGAMGEGTRTLVLTLTRIALVALTGMVVLDTLGISITPILASLGVGSVAVALALQDTLSNFFSGIYILLDKPIRIGDFIQMDGGLEGNVKKIGWRSTHILATSNNTIVIPNSKLSSSVVTNFYMPAPECSIVCAASVAYESDLARVETVAIEVGKQVLEKTPGGVASYVPIVRFHTFADSSVNFNVVLRAKSYEDGALIRHEFVKTLHKRFDTEGIVIPYPHQVQVPAKD